ncbi:TIGR02594 family protein [Aeromonas veronii]|uniref:TIGR02594 family protein n=1 Tax=Aeromonas veronii TaxID=654 RepID=UPI0038EFC858
MSQWIACLYDGKTKTAQYQGPKGTCLLRKGGTLPWRTNNPGNLRPRMVNGKPQPKKVKSHIGFAKTDSNGFFLIFPSYEVGFAELKKNLLRMHGDKTVENGIRAYAPSHENNTSKYIFDLEKLSGVSRSKVINRLSASELDEVAHAIEVIEGYHNEKDTRKEVTTKLSNVVVSDGSRPISGQAVVLKSGGIQKEFITDERGLVPPIPHIVFTCSINVCVPNPIDGSMKEIAVIEPSGPAKNVLAVFDGIVAKAKTMPLDPPVGQSLPERKKFQYTIKSGDTLWHLAKKYKSNVDAIVKANNIKDPARVYPGTKIWILPKANNSTELISAQSTVPKKIQSKPPVSTNTGAGKKPNKTVATVAVETTRDSKGKPLATIPLMGEEAPWMNIAIREAMQWQGRKAPKISDNYHREIGQKGTLSTVPWCASFANYCLKESGFSYVSSRSSQFPVNSKLFIKIDKPVYGAIMVLRTYSKLSGKWLGGRGHVGFVYGKTKNGKLAVLGGNQNNSIKLSEYREDGISLEYYSESLKQFVQIKHYAFYIPVAYSPKGHNELSIIDIRHVNMSWFDDDSNVTVKNSESVG